MLLQQYILKVVAADRQGGSTLMTNLALVAYATRDPESRNIKISSFMTFVT